MRFSGITAFAVALGLASVAQAAGPNLVQNGSFNTLNPTGANSAPSVSGIEVDGAFNDAGAVTGWTSGGGSTYNLYFYGNGKEAGGVTGIDAANRWGENGQRPNVNFTGDSPDGGAYMVLDGDPGFSGALSQTITGLTSGKIYKLTFDWAGGELYDRTGFFTSDLQVSFGGAPVQFTSTFTNLAGNNPVGCNNCGPPGDFSGWSQVTMYFKADGPSDVLSFLSIGTPAANLPPVAFLDGVSVVGVPEPAVWGLMVLGFGGAGALIRRRRRRIALA
jgi:hypothetical protein